MAQKGFNNIDENTKEAVDQAIKLSGLTDKEWLDLVAKTYLLQEIGTDPENQRDIAQLRGATKIIVDLFAHMIQRAAFEKGNIQNKANESIEEKRLIIEQMNTELRDAEKLAIAKEEELKQLNERFQAAHSRAEALEKSDEKNNIIIKKLQEENGALAGLVAEYKESHERSVQMSTELNEANHNIRALQEKLNFTEENRKSIQEAHDEQLKRLEQKNQEAIQMERERKEIEKEKEVFQIRTEYTQKFEKLQEEHTKLIGSLYEKIEQIRESQEQKGKGEAGK